MATRHPDLWTQEQAVYRAVVSGVSGHLGRELAAQLTAMGVEVHGLTRKAIARPPREPYATRLYRVDGSTDGLIATLREIQPDVVFHLAAIARREHQPADVVPFVETNILFGTQLLEAMRQCGCGRLIVAGSYLQHYATDGYRAFNLYAATKQALETLAEYYADAFRFAAVRLTLADIYSECDKRPKLMTDIADAWAASVPVTLRAEEAWIDPVHVEDAAAACLKAATLVNEGIVAPGSLQRYSVSSGQEISATELVRLFEKLGNRPIKVHRIPTQDLHRKIRPWRGQTLPRWTAKVSLEQGIMRIITQRT